MVETGDVIFEDIVRSKGRQELFGFILIILIVGLIIYRILGPIIAAIGVVPFVILYALKGSGIDYSTKFRIREDGVELVKTCRFYGWRAIDRVEILGGGESAVMLAIVSGNNVLAIPTNLNDRDITMVKELLQRKGVLVMLK